MRFRAFSAPTLLSSFKLASSILSLHPTALHGWRPLYDAAVLAKGERHLVVRFHFSADALKKFVSEFQRGTCQIDFADHLCPDTASSWAKADKAWCFGFGTLSETESSEMACARDTSDPSLVQQRVDISHAFMQSLRAGFANLERRQSARACCICLRLTHGPSHTEPFPVVVFSALEDCVLADTLTQSLRM